MHLFSYTSMKSWKGSIFTAVCLCVCLSGSCCEQNPTKLMHRFGRGFQRKAAYHTGLNPIKIGDLRSKVKVSETQYPFFLRISLLTSLLYISALLCPIKYALCRFVVEFHKNNQMDDDVMMTSWVTSFKFSPNNCPYFKFY